MTRETKFNLAFLALILALFGPAGVILFRDHLRPAIHSMADPDPMPHTVAYVAPGPTPPGMVRVYPKHTAKWIDQLMHQYGAGHLQLARDDHGMPMVSRNRSFQLLGVRRGSTATTVFVLDWRVARSGAGEQWILDAAGGHHAPLDMQTTPVAIPRLVQKELGANQMLLLPKEVQWVVMTFPPLADGHWKLRRNLAGSKADEIGFVPPFTKPVADTN